MKLNDCRQLRIRIRLKLSLHTNSWTVKHHSNHTPHASPWSLQHNCPCLLIEVNLILPSHVNDSPIWGVMKSCVIFMYTYNSVFKIQRFEWLQAKKLSLLIYNSIHVTRKTLNGFWMGVINVGDSPPVSRTAHASWMMSNTSLTLQLQSIVKCILYYNLRKKILDTERYPP